MIALERAGAVPPAGLSGYLEGPILSSLEWPHTPAAWQRSLDQKPVSGNDFGVGPGPRTGCPANIFVCVALTRFETPRRAHPNMPKRLRITDLSSCSQGASLIHTRIGTYWIRPRHCSRLGTGRKGFNPHPIPASRILLSYLTCLRLFNFPAGFDQHRRRDNTCSIMERRRTAVMGPPSSPSRSHGTRKSASIYEDNSYKTDYRPPGRGSVAPGQERRHLAANSVTLSTRLPRQVPNARSASSTQTTESRPTSMSWYDAAAGTDGRSRRIVRL